MQPTANLKFTQKINNFVDSHKIISFFTSPFTMAFFYGIFLFLYELKYARDLIPPLHPIFIGWALFTAFYNFVFRKALTKIPFWQFLVAFGVFALITTLLTFNYGATSNVKSLVLTLLPLVAFLPAVLSEEKEKQKASLLKALLGGSIVLFFASLSSLVLFILRIKRTVTIFGITHIIGLFNYIPDDPDSGVLLFGVFQDTNHAATYATLFAVYGLALFISCKKGLFAHKWVNKLWGIYGLVSAIIQILYFPLANSRGGWLSLAVAGLITTFFYFIYKKPLCKKQVLKILTAFAASVVCVAIVFGSLFAVRTLMSKASFFVLDLINTNSSALEDPSGQIPSSPNSPDSPLSPVPPMSPGISDTFEKTDDYIGGGRWNIWGETIKVYSNRFLFGTAPNNVAVMAEEYGIGEFLRYGKAVHNSYLDLLLNYGLAGFASLMGFWIAAICLVIKHIKKKGENADNFYYLIIFCVLAIACASAFLSCSFINTTAMYFALLILAGYLLCAERKGEKCEDC